MHSTGYFNISTTNCNWLTFIHTLYVCMHDPNSVRVCYVLYMANVWLIYGEVSLPTPLKPQHIITNGLLNFDRYAVKVDVQKAEM